MKVRELTVLLGGCAAAAAALPPYRHEQAFVGEDFFSKWDFWTASDPTKGFVEYVDEETAKANGLARAASNHVYMGSDFSGPAAKTGRRSVRIQSKEMFNRGLFVATLDHIPTGCGTWPAMWMFGEDSQHIWPRWGEYDIIEGVHMADRSMTTLHTTPDCDEDKVASRQDFAGIWELGATGKAADDCNINADDQWHNQGCSQRGPEHSMGPGFNSQGGGTYAAEWDPEAGHIRTWFWPNGLEPADIAVQRPQPSTWGKPFSYFSLKPRICSPDHFKNMRFTFDLTFCGDYGNPTFAASCPQAAEAMTCDDFVRTHPENLTEAYWSIRSLDVYQRSDAAVAPSPPAPAPLGTPAPSPGPKGHSPSPLIPIVPLSGPSPVPAGQKTSSLRPEEPFVPVPATAPTAAPVEWGVHETTRPASGPASLAHGAEQRPRGENWQMELAATCLALAAVLAVACYLKLQRMSTLEGGSPRDADDKRWRIRDSLGCEAAGYGDAGSPAASDWSGSPRSSRPGSPMAEAPVPRDNMPNYTWDRMQDSDARNISAFPGRERPTRAETWPNEQPATSPQASTAQPRSLGTPPPRDRILQEPRGAQLREQMPTRQNQVAPHGGLPARADASTFNMLQAHLNHSAQKYPRAAEASAGQHHSPPTSAAGSASGLGGPSQYHSPPKSAAGSASGLGAPPRLASGLSPYGAGTAPHRNLGASAGAAARAASSPQPYAGYPHGGLSASYPSTHHSAAAARAPSMGMLAATPVYPHQQATTWNEP